MADVTISGLVEGGKATGGPPFGPALGPLGVNINAIIQEINTKTKAFEGIKIPVKVMVNPDTKTYKVEVGRGDKQARAGQDLRAGHRERGHSGVLNGSIQGLQGEGAEGG